MSYDITQDILRLKQDRQALILAHYYEDGAIQDLADHVGDSYYLAQMGQKATNPVILLAGVVFMAESVKILNPDKKVIVPDLAAGCSLVEESPFEKYLAWRKQHPKGIAVTYVNSSAEVKAISDVIVTSSNAKKIVDAIPKDRPILFGPDKNLGRWLQRELGREMIIWPGACQVHVLFSARRLHELIQANPDALVIAHPECDDNVLAVADVVGSTSKLLETVEKHPSTKFIVATETGIFHEMKKKRPDAILIQAPTEDKNCLCNDCPYMKLNNLEKIKRALETLTPEVKLEEKTRRLAQISMDRMMILAQGGRVEWPSQFENHC